MRGEVPRRGFLGISAALAMLGGLAAGYGTFGAFAARFLYPAGPAAKAWMYVIEVARLGEGQSFGYRAPNGASISVTRQGEGEKAEDFIALSTVCPHLGCQVHWESQNQRYFCPCHNGVFDPSGMGTEGPPKGQPLERYPLKVEGGLLFIEVPAGGRASATGSKADGHREVAGGCCGSGGRGMA
jgi:cytochrome b6-f complex iron-sulfur subunit